MSERRAPGPRETLRALFDRGAAKMPPRPGRHRLTDRQLEIGCAVSFGLSDRAIGALLGLKEGTVGVHVHQALERIGGSQREELDQYVEEAFARSPLTFR